MSAEAYLPGPTNDTVRAADGRILKVPKGWELLPPGDAGLTRRVKAAGDHWVVQERKGRKVFSRGVWTSSANIQRIRIDLDAERSTETYAKRKASDAKRRDKVQETYVEDFTAAIVAYLNFHNKHESMATRFAEAVSLHATPVGSGTVARTKRIPIVQRAASAVIAWMRHQTTGYDSMIIPREKGKRREVRRMLARRSVELLDRYRRGLTIESNCPLLVALKHRESRPSLKTGT
jgi:hypothetical protein